MGRLRPLLGLDCWDELMRTHRYFTLWTAACMVGGCAIELLHALG